MSDARERVAIAPGYAVPRIVVGLWQLSAGHRPGSAPLADPARTLGRFVDAGLDTFDCADIYTGVEETLGRLVAARPPGAVRVHTKFVPDRSILATLERGYVRGVIERSLRRLRTERLDLVQFHWWDFAVPGWVEAAQWLEELRAEGKIRHVGLTNFDAAHVRELLSAGVRPVSDQVQLSLVDRRPRRRLVEEVRAADMWLLAYGTLAGGLLAGGWRGRARPVAPFANRSLHKYALIVEDAGGWTAFQALLEAVGAVADRHGVAPASVAVRWVLDRERVAAAVVGARDDRYLDGLLEALTLALDDEDHERLLAGLARLPGPPGGVYGLEREPAGKHAAIMRTDLSGA